MPQKFSDFLRPHSCYQPLPSRPGHGILSFPCQADDCSRSHTKNRRLNRRIDFRHDALVPVNHVPLTRHSSQRVECHDRGVPIVGNGRRFNPTAKAIKTSIITYFAGSRPETENCLCLKSRHGICCNANDVGWGLRMRNSFRILFICGEPARLPRRRRARTGNTQPFSMQA